VPAARTRLGHRSLWAFVTFVGLLAAFVVGVATGQRGGDEFFDNLWLTIPFLAAYAAAVTTFVTGAVAIASRGERSIAVVAVTIIGMLVTVYGILEVAFPH
jgi:hypothetical protein